ncbi:hypothetical protein BJ741DRAFT_614223 [Chytriomyces cf. hyalinus JEL632]|nr:hypothetical protein BJ741DRAFT_614223 [Chytriomyces cf. hyalinus JEL632]
MSVSQACLAATPAIQSTLQTCGFQFDSAGKPSIPATSTQTQVYTCLCNSASLSVFTNTLTACAADPAAAANLKSLIAGCPTVAAAAGTGAGTGTGSGAGQSMCEASIQQGIQALGVCGVTADASGLLKQTGTADQTSKCLCTAANVALYKGAITVCESEVKQTSPQGVLIAKQLVASCASGSGTFPGTGGGAAAGAASGAASAVASAAASSTSGGAVGAVPTTAVASTTKGSGGSSAFGMARVFALAALFV